MKKVLIALIAIVTFVACERAEQNEVLTKKGLLEGSQEVPAVTTSGSGTVEYSYNKSTKSLTYKATWVNLNDSATAMHIHGLAVRGQGAGVVQSFTLSTVQRRKEGTYTGSLLIDETAIKEADLLGGKYYLNLHSKTNTGGELRSQLEF